MTERAVKREDIKRYRRALTELGGEASLEQIAERAGGGQSDLGYVMACLLVPAPTQQDPSVILPYALPIALGIDSGGWRTWRTEQHWTADDLEEARRFFGPLGG